MKLNELRIGNWVQIDDLPPEQITLDVFVTLKQVLPTLSRFNALQITPEVLNKTDFKWEENGVRLGLSYSTGHEWVTISLMQHEKGWWVIITTHYDGKEKGINIGTINHLHQLQNIYFALTAEELVYKP